MFRRTIFDKLFVNAYVYLQHLYVSYPHFYVCVCIPISSRVSVVRPASFSDQGQPTLGFRSQVAPSLSICYCSGSWRLVSGSTTEPSKAGEPSLASWVVAPTAGRTPKQPTNWSILPTPPYGQTPKLSAAK
jgi:hypothetical protein